METTDFAWALRRLLAGDKLARHGWNGRNQFICIQRPDLNSKMTLPYIFISTEARNLVPWVASQTDILSSDWRTI